jgi:CRISPR/Cas system-associated exonuclease Cas4 (RecB family)
MKVTAKLLPEKDKTGIQLSLSVSKAKTFDDCKAKYKFCYIDKLPRIDQDFHIFGKFLHAVLEFFHRDLIKDSSLENDWPKVLDAAWDEALNDDAEKFSEKLTDQQINDATEIINEYREILEEEGIANVIAVEKDFYIAIDGIILLNGFIDRIQIDPDGVLHVADYKTTKDPKYLQDTFQLQTYCFALMLEDESIQRIRCSFILLRHGFDYLTHEFTRDEIMKIAEKFKKYFEKISDEKAFRASPQFLCKYCDFIDHCDAGRGYLIKRGVIKSKPTVGLRKW